MLIGETAAKNTDGNVLFWIPGEGPAVGGGGGGAGAPSFGESAEDLQYEKERWRVKNMCR